MQTLTAFLGHLNSFLHALADAFDADVKQMDAEAAAEAADATPNPEFEAFIARHS